MEINWLIVASAALIPLIVGFIWYHPAVFGKAWMKAAGVPEDAAKGANMALIFGLTILFGLMATIPLMSLSIHQMGFMSIFADEPSVKDAASPIGKYFNDFFAQYGHKFRTFKHGMLHGVLAGLFLGVPIMGTNALFERKGFKYIAINAGYWMLTLGLMAGVICGFA
ncbi:MAG: DUF1761 domain-containing protein [Chitinophagaceae bacterium]|nr:DUF1761 domain-containing protein [Chitinophagaceae bacterium]